MLWQYVVRNKALFTLLGAYAFLLALNAFGLAVWTPGCLVTHLTGYQCFGCGINRAAICLLQGNISGAYYYNPLLFLYLSGTVWWFVTDFMKYRSQFKPN